MEQLPDLQSDADVDALMARLRAKLSAPRSPSEGPASAVERSGNALRDFLAVQEEHVSATIRALQVMADTLEELQAQVAPTRGGRTDSLRRTNGRRRVAR
jgi:hypothetical protein